MEPEAIAVEPVRLSLRHLFLVLELRGGGFEPNRLLVGSSQSRGGVGPSLHLANRGTQRGELGVSRRVGRRSLTELRLRGSLGVFSLDNFGPKARSLLLRGDHSLHLRSVLILADAPAELLQVLALSLAGFVQLSLGPGKLRLQCSNGFFQVVARFDYTPRLPRGELRGSLARVELGANLRDLLARLHLREGVAALLGRDGVERER